MRRATTMACGGAVLLGLLTSRACWQVPDAKEAKEVRWLPASPEKLPRWRGFNLLEKFNAGQRRTTFREEDFRLLHQLGFNFVRLPMDYRCWIKNGGRSDGILFARIRQSQPEKLLTLVLLFFRPHTGARLWGPRAVSEPDRLWRVAYEAVWIPGETPDAHSPC